MKIMTTTMTRWTPESDLMRNPFDRLFNQMLQTAWGPQSAEGVSGRAWLPAVDVKETQDALQFHVELPGLKKEDVEITIENNVLTIAGERKFEKETKDENYHRLERSYGAFSRSFTVPTGVRSEQVEAKFENGVLAVTLPKQEESKPRKISIR
jgi:HSP20 family protein